MGVGTLLVCPMLAERMHQRSVYFPKTGPNDQSWYFWMTVYDFQDEYQPISSNNLNLSGAGTRRDDPVRFRAGSRAFIPTPIEHGGLFAREGAVIPVGKDKATVTCLDGPARTYPDGVDVDLDDGEEGTEGQVGKDDWRGVLIFPAPPPSGYSSSGFTGSTGEYEPMGEILPESYVENMAEQTKTDAEEKIYAGQWIEDDGISANPTAYTVKIKYWVSWETNEVHIEAKAFTSREGFKPLWRGKLFVLLPRGDSRRVVAAGNCFSAQEMYKSRGTGGMRMGTYVVPGEVEIL